MEMVDTTTTTIENEVKEIAKLLSRAAKNYQMYLANNRMFRTSLENLKSALGEFLEENETLTFVVREFELLHRTDPVYSNTDKYQSIAFRMYRDGVRLLSFHRGITDEDLLAFFESLTRCMETDNLEEDFVTLMWAKDLQAITYYEVNDFEADYQSLSSRAGNELAAPPEPLTPSTLEKAPWNRITTETKELKPTITLTPEDLAEVRDLTLAVDDDVFLRRAGEVLIMTLEIENVPEAYVDMEMAFNSFIDTCVARKCLNLGAEMLTDLKQRYAKYKDEQIEESLRQIVDARHSEKNMTVIGEILSGGRETQCEHCRMYLSELSQEAIPVIFKLLSYSSHQSSRHVLVSSLARIGSADPAQIARCAGPEMAEEAELALETLEAIGTEKALAEAMSFTGNFSPKIRAKVALIAAKLRTSRAQQVAQTLIHDDDHSVRRRALTTLAEITGDRCADTLIKLFTSKDFHQLSHDSKLSMLLVIRTLSPVGQRRVIEAILKSRSLFKRKPMDDTKAALIELAHLMDPEVAEDCLRWLSKHSSGKLRQAAKTTLGKVDHGNRT